jgi:O-glycosyl hydrolase
MNEERLRYKFSDYCDGAIEIDLHNDYTIVAVKKRNKNDRDIYYISLFIKENTVNTLNLIEDKTNIEIHVEESFINSKILKYVATLLSNGYFDKYINDYEYMLKCFDKGNDYFESESR